MNVYFGKQNVMKNQNILFKWKTVACFMFLFASLKRPR